MCCNVLKLPRLVATQTWADENFSEQAYDLLAELQMTRTELFLLRHWIRNVGWYLWEDIKTQLEWLHTAARIIKVEYV